MLFSRSTHIGLRSSLNCPNKKMFFFKNKDAYGYSTLRSRKKPTDESKTTTVVHTNSKRRPLRALFLTTIGALLMVSIKDYQSYAQYDDADPLVRPTSWPLYLYSYLPLNTLSRLWGSFNDLTLPISIRTSGYRLYSFLFGVNLDEMQDPDLTHYKNLGEFFYRKIKPETRPIDPLALLVSPSDGKVLKFGKVDEDGGIEQVKGMTYNLNALLGSHGSKQISKSDYLIYDENNEDHHQDFLNHLQNNTNYDCSARSNNVLDDQSLAVISEQGEKSILHPSTSKIFKASKALIPSTDSKKTNLFYAVIYLAPGDYHRFHSPVTWVTTLRRHFVGQLYSVAPYFQHTFNNLFVLNERVALLGYWKYGFFSMTPVGATNVGSIKINFDKDLVTNKSVLQTGERVKKNTCYEAHYSNASSLLHGHPLLKGEEVGGFKLGSTVVLVFEAPENFKFTLQENQYVKMGQGIGELEE